ncbi:Na+:H+ antiporter [Lysobacter xinjiangensis]|uniref:Na+:H+ antiporter n=1 Tax=Cognatilysobacter xinjiangensis TaxID=546892 RepID=A0ABQ3BWZ0_9GAMM|nr:Na+/H+ antiporter [Lysobacter xinjiangensis]GGZ60457.1 Na+:H+ antiporter [Lysobacter xinjiangensis]
MPVVTIVLVFLLTVVVTGFIGRLLPIKAPMPLLQIGAGALLSAFGFNVEFDPHLFLLLFIPPLLFLDGWRIPKGAFFRDWKPILALAIGLVFFTVLGMGWFIEWLVPAMPLAVAFALAAILSPTDPVAVGAMTANAPLPPRVMHILEGESLLNDATGLVCFTFAVTAAMTGVFSPTVASISFLKVAGGGVVAGVLVAAIVGRLNRWLVRRAGEEPGIQILVSLLIPFAAYLAAEHVHVSGILAAAVAGIAMHYGELSGRPLAATRMQRTAVWDTVQTALNGIIFVLLGEQLPAMIRRLPEAAEASGSGNDVLHLIGYVVVITLMLGALRFAWVWVSIRLTIFRAAIRGERVEAPATRLLAIIATAGVRGAITLAGILTLPLALADGTPFPARDVAVFIAMGVILLSLLIASVGLPLLARGLEEQLPEPERRDTEANARMAAAEAALRRIDKVLATPLTDPQEEAVRAEAAVTVRDVYQRHIDYGDLSGESAEDMQRVADAERRLRLAALDAERDTLYRLRRALVIDDEVHQKLVHEIDLMEATLTAKTAH